MSAVADLARVRARVLGDAAVGIAACADGDRLALVRAAVARALRAEGLLLPAAALSALVRDLTDELARLGPLEALLRDPAVTDVLVNGPHDVWVERAGRLERTAVRFADAAALHEALLRVIAPLGLRLDRASPHVDARLPDGSRLHALLPPLAPAGPVATIRRFPAAALGWADLRARGLAAECEALLRACVAQRRAVVCCGRTGAGKTTLLGVLLGDVGADERVVVIEDAPELAVTCPHAVRLETRPPNVEGAGAVTVRDLVRQSLRMRPDRIVVGEVRGAEVVDVLQALATGHEGCMTTLHARSAEEALVRLEGLALLAGLPLAAVRAQLATLLDVVVVLGRDRRGGRGVVEVAEIAVRAGRPAVRLLWRVGGPAGAAA